MLDDDSYNDYGHEESSDGQTVTGSYHVKLPDGRAQFVSYTADDDGYHPRVNYFGEAKYPAPAPAPPPAQLPAAAPPASYLVSGVVFLKLNVSQSTVLSYVSESLSLQ